MKPNNKNGLRMILCLFVFLFFIGSVNASDGVVSGGVTIEDGAMVFDGVDGYVEVPFSSLILSEFTIMARVKTESTTTTALGYISDDFYITHTSVANRGSRFFVGDGLGNLQTLNNSQIVNDGLFHQVVLTYKGGGTFNFYVDGLLGNSGTAILSQIKLDVRNTGYLRFGRQRQSIYFNGSIDQVLIFDRALTEAEITEIYNAGNDSYSPIRDGLVAEYSGQHYNGTPENPTTIYNTASWDFSPEPEPDPQSNIILQNVSIVSNQSSLNITSSMGFDGIDIYSNSIELEGIEYRRNVDSDIMQANIPLYTHDTQTTIFSSDFPLAISFLKKINTSTTHLLSEQYFFEKYNITNNLPKNISTITFSFHSENETNVVTNLQPGNTTLTNPFTRDIIQEEQYYTISGSTFARGTAYNVFRSINITNSLDFEIEDFELKFPTTDYSSNADVEFLNTTWQQEIAMHDGQNISFMIYSLSPNMSELYKYNYDAYILQRSVLDVNTDYFQEYQRYYFDVNYFSNFAGITGTKTVTDKINLTGKNNWHKKIFYKTEMPITHTSSLNGSELSVEYSIANLAPTSMTMSYFTEKGLIGGGGGGTPVGGDVVEVEVPVNITGKIVNVEDTQSISYWVFIVDSQTERTFTISSMQGVLQNVNISITGDIAPYVTHCFRQNKKTSECSKTVNLKDGEEGYVTLIFSANRNMTGTLEGTVRIEGMASVLELPISADIFFQTPFLVENLEKYAGVEEDPSNWLTMIYLLELGAALAIVGVLLS